MVFVKDDEIPVDLMYPFVLGLDAADVILAEKVLERAEAYDGFVLVCFVVGEFGVARDELPSLEILV